MSTSPAVFIHESAYVDAPAQLGIGSKVWHFSHVMAGAVVGSNCIIGQNVFIASGVKVGDNVKIQNNVSLYDGVILEDDVFCGPSSVFTNVINPRSEIVRKNQYLPTLVRRGATIGANATVVCGARVGRYAFIAAGAVVRGDVPDYALVAGVPGVRKGWMSRHGHRLQERDASNNLICPQSGWRYQETDNVLRCLDLAEDQPLPPSLTK